MKMMEYEPYLREHLGFWAQLSRQEIDLLLCSTSLAAFKKGTNIHNGNDDCVGMLLVKKGSLRTYLLSEEGKDITLYRLYEGDICVLSASCILNNITFEVYIDVEEDAELFLISAAAYSEVAGKNANVEAFSYKITAERFSDVMWAMQQILFMSFDKRLAIFLIDELSKTTGDTVRLTHEQIAKYIGSAREVVSRMLKYFANEGIVEQSRGGIKVLDKKRLRALTV